MTELLRFFTLCLCLLGSVGEVTCYLEQVLMNCVKLLFVPHLCCVLLKMLSKGYGET